jgi:hypothetical protein
MMPSATLDDIALRSNDPFNRAMDVFCVVMLQLLMLILAASQPDPDKRRQYPARGGCTILARLDAGETFDLPPLMIASIRSIASSIRPGPQHRRVGVEPSGEPSGAPSSAIRQNPLGRPKATRWAPASPHQPARPINRTTTGETHSCYLATAPPGAKPGSAKAWVFARQVYPC